jgi:lysozyme
MIESLINEIVFEEGFKSKPYEDTRGVLTIGYGTNIEQGITRDMAKAMLEVDLKAKIEELTEAKPFIADLPSKQQRVIFNMCYQLGVRGLLNFKKMWEALEGGDYGRASIEMIDSKWHKQTPNRAERLAEMMNS